MQGRYGDNYFWAGQNIQNLPESLGKIAQRGELGQVRSVRGKVKQEVESYLEEVR